MTMTWADYFAHPAQNISRLLQLAKSPLHYHHVATGGETVDTDALKKGRLAHVAILEPERYAAEVAIWDGGRRAGKVWDAWCEEHAGRIQVTEGEHEAFMAMSEAVRTHPAAGTYLASQDAVYETTLLWQHRASGLQCKSRFDFLDLGANVVLDLKTTRDASEIEFGKSSARLDYHTRAAFYSDAFRDYFGHEPTFVLVAVEKVPPYAVAVYRIAPEAIEAGRRRYEGLLAQLLICQAADRWPGYGNDEERELALPAWAPGLGDELDLDFGEEGVLRV